MGRCNNSGWALAGAIGKGAGFAFDAAYNSNFLRIRDGLDWVGSKIDKGLNKLFNPPRRKLFILV
ncbi:MULTISPECIES: hypothetical protein [unclassified Streptococcus]|uniref:hypothetical protein n=1 Tax=unclassified Streptococcus TaxID=2608887 RepID=UPI0010720948|nr:MULTISPECIES: hypothetical protein [unclassified Streptococcus]MBF0787326.1 hypothetical protein [Streptococcus sp. 19428wC2_LYSM12]MCQ9212665.1 hypothetical protein [Streptococcus sp. B01]MCQ9214005.1 hypothetical protein [Streptococcus sp. O1]TFV05810.1 hypothetical protein E4T79_05380 [Streptococcus sp. LYSM12]